VICGHPKRGKRERKKVKEAIITSNPGNMCIFNVNEYRYPQLGCALSHMYTSMPGKFMKNLCAMFCFSKTSRQKYLPY
jgi:hypothetical protein